MSETKICSKCRVEKAVGEFGKYKRARDGLRYECRACRAEHDRQYREAKSEYDRRYRAENRDAISEYKRQWCAANRETISERKRQYYAENRDAMNEWQRQYNAENREAVNERNRQYYAANPEKGKAQHALSSAIKSCTVTRPEACWHCGSTDPIDAHHPSYAEDMRLAVTWLCRSCHQRAHAETERLQQEA